MKPHVLRYWEQEFTQLRPMKRRGNRRYYQHHEVLMIRRIRELLYSQGFTISGARNKLQEVVHAERDKRRQDDDGAIEAIDLDLDALSSSEDPSSDSVFTVAPLINGSDTLLHDMRCELLEIRELLRYPA